MHPRAAEPVTLADDPLGLCGVVNAGNGQHAPPLRIWQLRHQLGVRRRISGIGRVCRGYVRNQGNAVARLERPKVFNQLCIACHSLGGQGGVVGPALDDVGSRRNYDNLVVWLTDPQQVKPGTLMPKLPLSEPDIAELASFLSQLK